MTISKIFVSALILLPMTTAHGADEAKGRKPSSETLMNGTVEIDVDTTSRSLDLVRLFDRKHHVVCYTKGSGTLFCLPSNQQ